MARQVMDLEEELSKIWTLVGELSEQLAANRAVVAQLTARSDNVKGQAAHAGAGFPLRRFNLDITKEEFQSEVERFAAHLVVENQKLQYDNKQLNSLLKEYETTLETVMGKFRGVSHASQQHDLSLHSYYGSLLDTLKTAHSSAKLHDDTSLSLLLARLSTLLRHALRSLGGEDVDIDLAGLLHNELNGYNGSFDGSPPPSPSKSTSSGKKSSSSGGRQIQRAPARPPPFAGFSHGATGGYSGTDGQGDWAMEREMEILRLEEENKALREVLGMAEESADPMDQDENLAEEDAKSTSRPEVPRQASLTVEELEAGAEREAVETEQKKRAWEDELERLNHRKQENHTPGTGLGGGGGVGDAQQKLVLSQSALGFTAEVPPEQAIDDSPDPDQ